MNQPSDTNRPPAITFICTIAFVWAALSIPLIFFSNSKSVGTWYPLYIALQIAVTLLGALGIWQMRKWGFYLYTAFAVINHILIISLGLWSVFASLIPAIVISVAYTHRAKLK